MDTVLDIPALIAVLKGHDSFTYHAVLYSVDDKVDLQFTAKPQIGAVQVATCILHSETPNVFTLRNEIKRFQDKSKIESDLDYKIMSTIGFDLNYKYFAYMLIMIGKTRVELLDEIKTKELAIYEKLERLINLFCSSALHANC